jgi:hypothetical protein
MQLSAGDSQPKRYTGVRVVLTALCLLLVVAGAVALGQLGKVAELNSLFVRLVGGVPPLKVDPFVGAARLGVLVAVLVLVGSIASLVYLSLRRRWVWNIAIAALIIATGISSLVAIQGYRELAVNPARGDFAGLANLGTAVVHVTIPIAVAVLNVISVLCLIVLRPRPVA